MSTVKIKTEPAATTAAAAVDLQVKLEQSLSTTADIKLEQHSSNIDTKVEPGSDADSEEGEEGHIKSESSDDDDEDTNQFTLTPRKQQRFVCKHPGCGRSFNSTSQLKMHHNEHKLQTELKMYSKIYTLTRQSLSDRWQCPIPACEATYKTVDGLRKHIRKGHGNAVKLQQQPQEHHPPARISQCKVYFFGVDDFYVASARCGYHNTIGVFICYECMLVPECPLTHLQQKHAYDEKSIDNSALPDSAVAVNANPNINQHTSNPHLASAISRPYWQHHYIVRGWLCVTSDCRYFCYPDDRKSAHRKKVHQGEQMSTVPALLLRLAYTKAYTSCFLITRIDQTSDAVTTNCNTVSQHKLDSSHSELDAQDENGDGVEQNGTTDESNQKRQFTCRYDNCRRIFNSAAQFYVHRRDHTLEDVMNVYGTTYILTRQSLDDGWACPIPDCETMHKNIDAFRHHIKSAHYTLVKQKRAGGENDNSQQQQQAIKRRQSTICYLKVNDFCTGGTRCGYHTTTGLFICYECRLVPECLLTHLQQKHGCEEKSIDNSALPESARITGSDPNINQHTSNPHLAAAISQSSQPQHPDIIKGWLCVTSDCGYIGYSFYNKFDHKKNIHQSEQITTAPALVLRLLYAKVRYSCFLIARLDTATNISANLNSSMSQNNSEYDDDDGDELVLSDYSD